MSIFITSDWHFNHDKEFCYGARGFNTKEEMNEAIIKNHNSVVGTDDEVYCLGDCFMGADLDLCKKLIERLNGKIHIILGNHDSAKKIEVYKQCKNVVSVLYADIIKYKKYTFYVSHYPTLTRGDYNAKDKRYSICGHYHTEDKYFHMNDYIYHAELDAHNMFPISINKIIEDIKEYKNDQRRN